MDQQPGVGYTLIDTSSGGTREIDDKCDLYSRYSHSLRNSRLATGMLATFRTQLVNSYDYSETPRKRISVFFAPAYIVFSPGIQYATTNNAFGLHFGPHVRWVVVTNGPYSLNYQGAIKPDGTTERTLASLYGVSPQREVCIETGLYFSALFNKEIFKNVFWKTPFDVSNDILEKEPFLLYVYWINPLAMKVNNWLTVNYNFDLYYDNNRKMFGPNNTSPGTQMKSLLDVGAGFKF